MNYYLVLAIGFLAQAFFSARILFQWALSERAKQVVSPTIYWVLSLFGAYLLFIYGWLRDDFSIILGQMVSYYIYLWNLNKKGVWGKVPLLFRAILLATPLIAVGMVLKNVPEFIDHFFRNSDVPFGLLLFGSAGQLIFTLRFVYQWYDSARRGESTLSPTFWVISLVGSGIIVSYGLFRLDWVLILGQMTGFIAYSRNLVIGYKQKKKAKV